MRRRPPDSTRCYRVVSVTADHQSGGSAGHFRSRRGSQLARCLQPAPRLQSQAPLRPCPRQRRETPGQTAETLPAADCLMLTTERIQAKGGGAHQELLHRQRHFSAFQYISCSFSLRFHLKKPKKNQDCFGNIVMIRIKLSFPHNKAEEEKLFLNRSSQSESGRARGAKKKKAGRTTAPFSLRPVDMKDHIMSEIRGNYTGSAL